MAFAAEAQRHLVSIHPFADGNVRVSRLVMDHALVSEGLPPALLRDPKIDYFVSPEAWADEVRTGVMTTYEPATRHVGGFNSAVGAGNPVAIAIQWGAIVGLTSDPQATIEALYVNVCE